MRVEEQGHFCPCDIQGALTTAITAALFSSLKFGVNIIDFSLIRTFISGTVFNDENKMSFIMF